MTDTTAKELDSIDYALHALAVIVENYPWASEEYKSKSKAAAEELCSLHARNIKDYFDYID